MHTRLFHPMGDLLFDDAGLFIKKVYCNMGILGSTRRIIYPDGHSEETRTVTYETMKVTDQDLTSEQLLLASEKRRGRYARRKANLYLFPR